MTAETADNGKFFELLALHVASGKTIRAAAEESGCSERQGYRIAATRAFKARVGEIRSEMTSAAVGELSAAAAQAVATIRELLGAGFEPAVRLNAAKSILNALGPMSELSELRDRLSALESER